MVVTKQIALRFLNQDVSIERIIDYQPFYSKGKIVEVTDVEIVLEFNGSCQVYDLASISSIRGLVM